MSFRIIALQPLEGTSYEHKKNLEINHIYYFHNDYSISKDGNEITYKKNVPDNFFSEKIQIAAIVGKNGSGKSSIIELLIKGINNLFYIFSNTEESKKCNFHTIDFIQDLNLSLYYEISGTIFKINLAKNKYKVEQFSQSEGRFLKDETSDYSSFDFKKFQEHFFYTEIINYSIYSYNSVYEGDWISNLFHKNDGYQTPVVLNPFRTEGNININTENDLARQRLMANLLKSETQRSLTDNSQASHFMLTLKDINNKIWSDRLNKEVLINFDNKGKTVDYFLESFNVNIEREKYQTLKENIDNYIYKKLMSICLKYDYYKDFIGIDNLEIIEPQKLFEKIKGDSSHITFKLKQLIHYINYNYLTYNRLLAIQEVGIQQLSTKIHKEIADADNKNLILFVPPPIFNIEIKLNENYSFSELSSGEKQFIYSINSIYYHLLNLESVHSDTKRLAYKHINIILDEIELYFHPEYQRKFLHELIEGIKKLNLSHIENINLLISTHSPFILSDVPSNNILFLENGETKQFSKEGLKKSFAANIHDMFKDSFFMKATIGEFARNKIEWIIFSLNTIKTQKPVASIEHKEELISTINLIDEPILRFKLSEMYYEIFPSPEDNVDLITKHVQSIYGDGYEVNRKTQ